MKKTLTLAFAFLFSLSLFSQNEWAQDDAIWHYQCWNVFSPPIFYQYYAEGDTVIQGIDCKITKRANWERYTYSENGKVFIYNPQDTTFGLLYDFDMPQGGEWKIRMYEGSYWPFDSITIQVDSVFDNQVSGHTISTQIVSLYGGNGQYLGWDSIYYNIGSFYNLYVFTHPNPDSITDVGEGCRLHCFWLGDTLALNFQGHDCIISSNKERIKDNTLFSISPNPATDVLHVSFQNKLPSNKGNFQIFDISGRLVKKQTVGQAAAVVDVPLSHFPAGMYFIKYVENGAVKGVERFVVKEL